MKKKGRDQAKLGHIDKKVREAFGVDEERLAEEYDRLAEQMKSSETPAAPEGEFEKLLKRVEEAAGKKHKPKG